MSGKRSGLQSRNKEMNNRRDLKKTPSIVSAYENDLEDSLDNMLVQLAEVPKTDVASAIDSTKKDALEIQYYKFLLDNSLESCFPNLEIALRIYLSLMITNCSGGCSFSTLKRIKNEFSNTMSQQRLNYPALMNMEYDLLRKIYANSILNLPT
ncbi:hypothetical protein KGM_204959 [Danaus plexippus plexippus]|uniref:HAT C-terminal dimerisation domain-containing protein n=1 Tax=Danaus plexippus plexippus TaxID=278856 RepID=A0A212EL13_DANPL|nr:hypothetical protein KGM_204959 [Danaus plexippus plexippus]